MSRLLPFKSEPASSPGDPRVLDLGDEATGEALSALSSETARKILAAVYEEPRTPPELRDEVGTSLQNVHYHVENLREADLIEPAGTGYSEKGTEMTIYAPASEAVVLFAGREHDRSRLKTALSRLLGAVGLLAIASVAVRRFVETLGTDVRDAGDSLVGSPTPAGDGGGRDGGGATATEPGRVADTPADTAVATDEGTATAPAEDTVAGTTAEPEGTGVPATEPTETALATGTPTDAATPGPAPTAAPSRTPTDTPLATATDTVTPAGTGTPTETAAVVNETTFTATPTSGGTGTDAAGEAVRSGADGLFADPAVAFFLGGLFMLSVAAAWWYLNG